MKNEIYFTEKITFKFTIDNIEDLEAFSVSNNLTDFKKTKYREDIKKQILYRITAQIIMLSFLSNNFKFKLEGKEIEITPISHSSAILGDYLKRYRTTKKFYCALDKDDKDDKKPFKIVGINENIGSLGPEVLIEFEDGTKKNVFPEQVFDYVENDYNPIPGECIHGTDPAACAYCND